MMGGTTWYLNGSDNSLLYEKEVKANGITENRHYLQAAGMTFAMAVLRTGPGLNAAAGDPTKRPTQLEYYQQDHLGSIAAIADENGKVIERLGYDPWGKRRYPNGIPDKADAIVGVNTDRGYTMHEHLDEVGVIHMNGRVYDPLIGRFMSADPFIQSPGNLQSYNRYAYVMNNPLAFTDPSGYWSLRGFSKSVVTAPMSAMDCYFAPVRLGQMDSALKFHTHGRWCNVRTSDKSTPKQTQPKAKPMNRELAHTGATYPVLQAPMGWIARSPLASAVSRAGGLGIIETSSGETANFQREITTMVETGLPFGVNLPIRFLKDDAMLRFVCESGVKFVTTSAGSPAKFIAPLKAAGIAARLGAMAAGANFG